MKNLEKYLVYVEFKNAKGEVQKVESIVVEKNSKEPLMDTIVNQLKTDYATILENNVFEIMDIDRV